MGIKGLVIGIWTLMEEVVTVKRARDITEIRAF